MCKNDNSAPIIQYDANYLTIEALEDGLTASLSITDCEFCVDGSGEWMSLPAATSTPSIDKGHCLSFKAIASNPVADVGIGTFSITKKCNLRGNILSMRYGDTAAEFTKLDRTHQFNSLFRDCTTIENIDEGFLPATELRDSCYRNLFRGCSNLKTAPKLPAGRLTTYCYAYMFQDCVSLEVAPDIIEDIMYASYCARNMFYNCTNLKKPSKFKTQTTKLSNNCFQYMYANCVNLEEVAELIIDEPLGSDCYGMYMGCTSLKDASKIIINKPQISSYRRMFYGCTSLEFSPTINCLGLSQDIFKETFYDCQSLQYIKALFTSTPGSSYTSNWVYGVPNNGIFVKNKAATWNVRGVNGIPNGWTIEEVEV